MVCCAGVCHVYPITRLTDYSPPGAPTSTYHALKGEPCKALKVGFDAHVAAVAAPTYQVAMDLKDADYVEVVQEVPQMLLPIGILWVRR